MPRHIRAQRIGRGSPTYVASIQRRIEVGIPPQLPRDGNLIIGHVRDILHDPGRGAPVAEVEVEDQVFHIPAVQGMYVGQKIEIGEKARPSVGNIVPVGVLPEGAAISNVELRPGDGGVLARSSGAYASVISQVGDKTIIRLPSRKLIELSGNCLAVVGVVAGSGRVDKPMLKAGKKYWLMKARHRPYPRVRGVTMVPARHPFGGGSHKKIGRPETVKRTAPPGRKVGLIAARRTGKRK
ncbi:MAG: 50S ribosomal protein L2 [Nitrososphaerota archaeon]|nr:50S ribosomal protein L2 [Candidatus Calditenuaceae archaeon]MDW8072682.1 50S ribosomal protein L2 [Nitrososphaerota archaeon]